jgi:hypothetical protein
MAKQWFYINVPPKRGFNEFVRVYRFVHGVLPLLRELRRNMGRRVNLFSDRRLRLLSSDEEFETFAVVKRRRGNTFFHLNTICVELD